MIATDIITRYGADARREVLDQLGAAMENRDACAITYWFDVLLVINYRDLPKH